MTTDSPKANKRRKSVALPYCRIYKPAKFNTKENLFEASAKKKTEDIVEIVERKEEKNGRLSVKDTSKLEETSDKDNPMNKKTPDEHNKNKPKVPVNSITKCYKKIDSKDTINEAQSPNFKSKELKTETRVDINSKDDSKNCNTEKVESENKDVIESKNNETCNSDSEKDFEELHETSSLGKEKSHLNETENMDVDSDVNADLDESHDDSGSHKSDTDSTKTEHEDADSKDDNSRGASTKYIIPTKNKLLDSKSKEKKLTPKQLEKNLQGQKKRGMREKQRQEREKKLQEEREIRKREKEEKQREHEQKKREREEKDKMAIEQKRIEKELKEQKKQAELEQKQKEKEAKEENRRKREEAIEEEKKRKEEEKLEEERKEQKAASNFVRKVTENEKSKFDGLFDKSDLKKRNLYISKLRNNKFEIRKSKNTWAPENNGDIVILACDDDEDANVIQAATKTEKHHAKLLLFNENRYPLYWGTCRKKSMSVDPRSPFRQEEETEIKLQETGESSKREKEEKQREREKKERPKSLADKNSSTSGTAADLLNCILKPAQALGFTKMTSMIQKDNSQEYLLKFDDEASTSQHEKEETQLMLKVDVKERWELVKETISFANNAKVPLVVLFNIKLTTPIRSLDGYMSTENLPYKCYHANQGYLAGSRIVLLQRTAMDSEVTVNYFSDYKQKLNEKNDLLSVKVQFRDIKFCCVIFNTSSFLTAAEEDSYIRLVNKFSDKKTMLITLSNTGRVYNILSGNSKFTLKNERQVNSSSTSKETLFYVSHKLQKVFIDMKFIKCCPIRNEVTVTRDEWGLMLSVLL